ncbi:flippase [Desulfosporosinus nitroreducens]|uniref:flippase n=1 Tax=Desulfosporosinus nitroreducens TaxID=2018668 RepID=UPI00207C392A|nr:flippase [Desulfosporosinus nitroreducens]MCO1600969.1 flippase [Desulfosporosinus nitroreducens]
MTLICWLKMKMRSFRGEGLFANLLRASIASIALKLFYTIATLAINIILARIMGAEGYGIYSYALALTTIIAIPAQIGLPTLLTRNIAAYQIKEQWGLMRGILRFSNEVVILISLVFVFIAGVWAYMGHYDVVRTTTFAWALLLVPLIALGSLRGATLCGLRRVFWGQLPDQLILPGVFLVFILIGLFKKINISPSMAITMQVIAAFLAFIIGSWFLLRFLPVKAKEILPEYDKRTWIRSILPLSFLAGMQIINNQTGIVMLGIFAPAADVGVFRVVVQGSSLVAFTLSAMNMALAPNFSRLYTVGDHERLQRAVTGSSRAILLTGVFVASIFIPFGHYILGYVFGEEYIRGYVAFSILCLGQLVNAGSGSVGYLLNMTGHERDTAIGVTVAAIVNIAFCFAFIPILGINGAALANTTTFFVWNVILVQQVYRRIGIISTAIVPKCLKNKLVERTK